MPTPTKKLLNAGPSERGWHHFETALRCMRLNGYWSKGLLQMPMSEPLVRGSLLHIGLAHHYQRLKEIQTGGNPDDWYTPVEAIRKLAIEEEENSDLWIDLVPVAEKMVEAYISHYGSDPVWEVVDVERELRARFGPGKHLYTQRADLIVRDSQKRVWIVDHKTANRISHKTYDSHILNGQMIGYQVFGRLYWPDEFAGVIINRITTRPPYKLDRRPLEPAPHAVTRFVQNLLYAEENMERWKDKPLNEWPAAYSDMICTHKYGKCDAFELCRWGVEENG